MVLTPGITRRRVEYTQLDGSVATTDQSDLLPRVRAVLEAAVENDTPWQLYERPDGIIAILADPSAIAAADHHERPAEDEVQAEG
jgi:hypothetical protein